MASNANEKVSSSTIQHQHSSLLLKNRNLNAPRKGGRGLAIAFTFVTLSACLHLVIQTTYWKTQKYSWLVSSNNDVLDQPTTRTNKKPPPPLPRQDGDDDKGSKLQMGQESRTPIRDSKDSSTPLKASLGEAESTSTSNAGAVTTPDDGVKIGEAITTIGVDDPDPSKTVAKGNQDPEPDLILWIKSNRRDFDKGFEVSEKNIAGEKKGFMAHKSYETRECSTQIRGNKNNQEEVEMAKANGIPICDEVISANNEMKDSTPVLQKTSHVLVLCYAYTSTNAITHANIFAVTSHQTGQKLKYRSIRNSVDAISCPKHCTTREGQEYDENDHLCKTVSDPRALPPLRRFGGSCDCLSTCYTPIVANFEESSQSWPWKNFEEKLIYHGHTNFKPVDPKHRQPSTYEMRFICPTSNETSLNDQDDLTTTTTSNASSVKKSNSMLPKFELPDQAYRGFSHHFFFIPHAKLIFCGVPKGGVTEWMKFLRYTMGAQDYLSFPHFKEDREEFYMSRLSKEKAVDMILDPKWTKAIFIRNPAERLLSAYNDKGRKVKFTHQFFGAYNNGTEGEMKQEENKNNSYYVPTFHEFVNLVTYNNSNDLKDPRGVHGKIDPHWQPQSMMCGMDYLLPYLDFIGNFNYIAEHTKLLLQKVGLWDDYGSTFDPADDGVAPTDKRVICSIPPPHMLRGNTTGRNFKPTGFNQRGPTETTGHLTNSKTKMEKAYTPELLQKVRETYIYDYAIWDDIKDLPVETILSGRDLNIVKQLCG